MHGFPTAENPDPLFLYLIFLFITFFLSYHITRHISNFSLFLPISLSFPLWTVYTPKECQRNERIFILLPFEDTDSPKLPLKKTSWSCSILWFLRRQINKILLDPFWQDLHANLHYPTPYTLSNSAYKRSMHYASSLHISALTIGALNHILSWVSLTFSIPFAEHKHYIY